jgi:hypothetical protein
MITLNIDGVVYVNVTSKVSREAVSKKIYFSNFNVIKILNKNCQASLISLINDAKNSRLPIARGSRCYPANKVTITQGTVETVFRDVIIYQSEKHIGDFFQLSKHGGESKLENFKKAYPQHKRAVDNAIDEAKKFGLTDIQGFLCAEQSMPVRFIDPHR